MQTVDELAEEISGTLNQRHWPDDPDRLAAITQSMTDCGWIGAPVVADGENALTGTHRIQAAHDTDTPLRVVQIADLCTVYGVDWNDIYRAYDYDWERLAELDRLLPRDVVAYLGLDQY